MRRSEIGARMNYHACQYRKAKQMLVGDDYMSDAKTMFAQLKNIEKGVDQLQTEYDQLNKKELELRNRKNSFNKAFMSVLYSWELHKSNLKPEDAGKVKKLMGQVEHKLKYIG